MSRADESEPEPLPEAEEAELLAALCAALRPVDIDERVHGRLIDMALEDPLAPPSAQELLDAARLRDLLRDASPHEALGALAALRAPFSAPSDVEQASGRALATALGVHSEHKRRSNVVYAAFGAASVVLAAAAAAVLVSGLSSSGAPSGETAAFIRPRSTAPLFAEPFETAATTTRMDLIASARSRDLRDNRYSAWGVR